MKPTRREAMKSRLVVHCYIRGVHIVIIARNFSAVYLVAFPHHKFFNQAYANKDGCSKAYMLYLAFV